MRACPNPCGQAGGSAIANREAAASVSSPVQTQGQRATRFTLQRSPGTSAMALSGVSKGKRSRSARATLAASYGVRFARSSHTSAGGERPADVEGALAPAWPHQPLPLSGASGCEVMLRPREQIVQAPPGWTLPRERPSLFPWAAALPHAEPRRRRPSARRCSSAALLSDSLGESASDRSGARSSHWATTSASDDAGRTTIPPSASSTSTRSPSCRSRRRARSAAMVTTSEPPNL